MNRQKIFVVGGVLVLAAGVLLTFALVRFRPEPEIVVPTDQGRLVRTLILRKEDKTFWVNGYGTVRPKIEVTVVPEVSGRVIERSPGFRSGGFIQRGELLFEIDPSDYRLTVTQRRAQIAQLEADIARLVQEEKNSRSDLAIAERQLKVVRTELERNRKLRRQGVISPGQFDASLQAVLAQERTVQSIRNSIALFPSLLAQKRAALSVTRAQLQEALLDLGRTKVIAPFSSRVRQAKIEAGDYVRSGQEVGKIHDMSVIEVPVSIPVEEARWAFRRVQGVTSFPRSREEVQKFFPRAEILWTRFGQTFRWEGQVTLVEAGLDEATRAITLIVQVDEPLKNWVPGKHPPLVVGMFVKARIQGITLSDVFAIPRAALRANDEVFILREGRLDIRKVEVIRKGQDEAVIRNEIQEGESLILSAIPDPVVGMKLRSNGSGGADAGAPGGSGR